MTTELARTFIDDLDQLPAEIPGAAELEPGRLSWEHGINGGGVKTAGCFYGKDVAFTDAPPAPWVLDERHADSGEIGYSVPELRLSFLGSRSQWFIPGDEPGDPAKEWLTGYQDGAKKLTEYLVLIDGMADPMVLSVSGKYKAGSFSDILNAYRRGALAQAMRKTKRTLPPWAFWLPIANRRDRDGKTIYEKAQDGNGKEYGSTVTPPALAGVSIAVTIDVIHLGIEVYQQYKAAGWFEYKRVPRGTDNGTYTIEEHPALPPGRNTPQALDDSDLPDPFA